MIDRESGRAAAIVEPEDGTVAADAPAGDAPAADAPAGGPRDGAVGGHGVPEPGLDSGDPVPQGRRSGGKPIAGRRWVQRTVAAVAVLGVVGTVGFGHAWASERNVVSQEAAASTTARSFLLSLTNFDAKTVDADFSRVQQLATGSFAVQAKQFFGSSIRQQLEAALASSRGQIRSLYVQSGNATSASVFAVVDQTYVNDKMSAPAADVLRVAVNLRSTAQGWRIAAVTVLTNPSSGTGSGSVTGQSPGAGSAAPASASASASATGGAG